MTQQPPARMLALPDSDTLIADLKAVTVFQALVRRHLTQGHDYGVIPGTKSPTLLKPGAEKIAKLLGCADEYTVVDQTVNWATGFFHFLVCCRLTRFGTGELVSSGLGECNNWESKYRYRWFFESQLPQGTDKLALPKRTIRLRSGSNAPQYRMENDDPYSLVNTILKMAKKRALVDAALSAGRLSDIFTQDLEEMGNIIEGEFSEVPPEEAATPTDSLSKRARLSPSARGGRSDDKDAPGAGESHDGDLDKAVGTAAPTTKRFTQREADELFKTQGIDPAAFMEQHYPGRRWASLSDEETLLAKQKLDNANL